MSNTGASTSANTHRAWVLQLLVLLVVLLLSAVGGVTVGSVSDTSDTSESTLLDWSELTSCCGITAKVRLNQAAFSNDDPATVLHASTKR